MNILRLCKCQIQSGCAPRLMEATVHRDVVSLALRGTLKTTGTKQTQTHLLSCYIASFDLGALGLECFFALASLRPLETDCQLLIKIMAPPPFSHSFMYITCFKVSK